MQQELLPLFPLEVVLFPRTPLPLHIFEERYKQMVGEALKSKSEFGIVLAGEKGIASTGCTASVEKVMKSYSDGRMDILTVGRRRFEIILLNNEKSYLQGAVEFFDDEEFEDIPDETAQRVLEAYAAVRDIEDQEPIADPEMDDPQVSFQLAQVVSDLEFRQVLLALRSEAGRMRHLAEHFPAYASRQRQTQHIKAVAPRNGHGKWPPSA
ncbi:MAG: LON peptidase substrate-binding domain-containing protein [Acidobacteriota bacterium]|nr:LON peptidase substrate-binding domain-containing protein [Acidobacteriota bacterium]